MGGEYHLRARTGHMGDALRIPQGLHGGRGAAGRLWNRIAGIIAFSSCVTSGTVAGDALVFRGTIDMPQEFAQLLGPARELLRPMFSMTEAYAILGGCAIVLFASLAFHLCRRYHGRALATARLQAQLTRAQLQALKTQLHPHFLFNTLNTVSVLVTEDPAKAKRMIVLLSDLLRQSFESSQSDEVTLRRELELLHAYLEIQRMRFRRRLSVSFDIGENVLDANIPTFTLQPIVENAIRHGIDKQRKCGRIDIRANRVRDSLVLQVQDNGPGLSMDKLRERNGNGIGLGNTSKRLSCIYGSASRISIERVRPEGTVATIVIPFHESGHTQ
jgi:sensor histidine kinase YesM